MSPRGTPAIACIGVIGRNDNPLHISLFPPDQRDSIEFQFLLTTCLDIFEARLPQKTADHDFGLLQAIDERLAMYGWLTNTGIKFVIVIDMEGRPITATSSDGVSDGGADLNAGAVVGLRDSDLRPAFRALHQAYIRLLRNPFYDPDEHDPNVSAIGRQGAKGMEIESPRFIGEVKRIGEAWYPGIGSI